jgi:drug/metabolite transporter (DMT)-like permease
MTASRLHLVLPPAALVVLWSSGFIGAELGTRQASVSTLLAWRYLVAGAILVAICLGRGERIGRIGIAHQVVLGVLGQAAYLGLTVGGVALGATAGTSALIASLQPLVVIALAALVLAERVHRAQLVGLGIGLVGVVLVVGGDLTSGDAPWPVYLLPAAGMLALSVSTVLQQRWRPRESVLMALTAQTVTAAVVFWVFAAAQGQTAAPASTGFWSAIAWVVVLSSFGGYGAYLYVSRLQGATRASTWLYLTPPTTMLWAAVMFGDRVTALGLAGLAVSAVGVTVALSGAAWPGARCRRSRRRSRTARSRRTPTTGTARSPRAEPSRSRGPVG